MSADLPAAGLPDQSNTVAVVTTFHPEPGLGARLRALDGQVLEVIVVDNGSRPDELNEVDDLERDESFHVIRNGRNEGLAKALNQGIARAAERRASWVLLLDQDSTPLPGLVSDVARIVTKSAQEAIALVGTAPVGRHRTDSGVSRHSSWEQVPIVITSGTLVAVGAWRELRGFREDFFVDYVDIEFSLRARAHGYAVLQSLRPSIEHMIGRQETHRLFGRTVSVTNHDAGRRRSITTNRVVLWRTFVRSEPRYVLHDVVSFVKETVKIVLFEGDRGAKLRSIRSGLRDGWRKTIEPESGLDQKVTLTPG